MWALPAASMAPVQAYPYLSRLLLLDLGDQSGEDATTRAAVVLTLGALENDSVKLDKRTSISTFFEFLDDGGKKAVSRRRKHWSCRL